MQSNSSNTLLSSNKRNISLTSLISNLFIEEQFLKINYSTYFHQCSPVLCTYPKTMEINLSDGISLLLSLYTGLTILLRLITPAFIYLLLNMRCHLGNIQLQIGMLKRRCLKYIRHLGVWIKELNLFQSKIEREINDIKLQRLITKVYLICLFGRFSISVILYI